MQASRGIDHVVLSVRDLDGAADFFQRAGFTLTPRAETPFGTCNRLALLNGNFIDLLATTSPENIPPHRPDLYSLSAQHQDLLMRREGLSFVVMLSDDARRDHQSFVTGGLPASEPIEVTRLARQPNGEDATFSFTMVVVADPKLKDAQHFIYQVRTPETFWHAAYQKHANSALEIGEVVLVADNLAEMALFYAVLAAPHPVRTIDDQLHVEMPKGRIVVLPPAQLAQRFDGVGVVTCTPRPYIVGFQVLCSDLDAVEDCLRAGAIPYFRAAQVIRIGPEQAFGAVIEFMAGN